MATGGGGGERGTESLARLIASEGKWGGEGSGCRGGIGEREGFAVAAAHGLQAIERGAREAVEVDSEGQSRSAGRGVDGGLREGEGAGEEGEGAIGGGVALGFKTDRGRAIGGIDVLNVDGRRDLGVAGEGHADAGCALRRRIGREQEIGAGGGDGGGEAASGRVLAQVDSESFLSIAAKVGVASDGDGLWRGDVDGEGWRVGVVA